MPTITRVRTPGLLYVAAQRALREAESRISTPLLGTEGVVNSSGLAHPPPGTLDYLNWVNQVLGFEQACREFFGLSPSRAYQLMQQGHLPRGEKLGPRRVGWRRVTLLRWRAAMDAADQAERQTRESKANKAAARLQRTGRIAPTRQDICDG